MTTRVFCPCSEKLPPSIDDPTSLQLSSFPTTIGDVHTQHIPQALNFCENCQAVKCRKCTELEVVSKYCPRCLNVMKPEYSVCSRNCLDCPLCFMNLIITQNRDQKTFTMKCASCPYEYQSVPLDKLRSMSRVIKAQINKTPDVTMFSNLQKFYIQEKQLSMGKLEIPKSIVTKFSQVKIKDCDIYEFMRRSTVQDLDHESASLKYLAEQSNNTDTIPYDLSQRGITQSRKQALPLQTRLRCKYNKRCKACRRSLMKPDNEPTSVKFYKLSNAIEYLPSLRIHHNPTTIKTLTTRSENNFVLILQNTLECSLKVTLSAHSPAPGIQGHVVSIPISSLSLQPRPHESALKLETVLECTPSIELTRGSKASRVELMNRPSVKYDTYESVYEQRKNFAAVPLRITLGEYCKSGDKVEVPLLVSFTGDDIGVAFWSVFDLGVVE